MNQNRLTLIVTHDGRLLVSILLLTLRDNPTSSPIAYFAVIGYFIVSLVEGSTSCETSTVPANALPITGAEFFRHGE